MEFLLIVVAMFALMYFMMIRPQKKRLEQMQSMRDSMVPGTRIMLNSGIFATVRALADNQAVVELAPGVEVTVVKEAIVKVVTPDEEEFEFDDSVPAVEADDVFTDEVAIDQPEPAVEVAEPVVEINDAQDMTRSGDQSDADSTKA